MPLEAGDRVFVRKTGNLSKLGARYYGPLRVLKIKGVACLLEDLATGKKARVHMDRLKHSYDITLDDASNVNDPFPLGQHYDDSIFAASKGASDSNRVDDPGGGAISLAPPAVGKPDVTSHGDIKSGTGVVDRENPVTLGDQMLSGTRQNVFRDKVRLKPSNTYQLRSKGPLTV